MNAYTVECYTKDGQRTDVTVEADTPQRAQAIAERTFPIVGAATPIRGRIGTTGAQVDRELSAYEVHAAMLSELQALRSTLALAPILRSPKSTIFWSVAWSIVIGVPICSLFVFLIFWALIISFGLAGAGIHAVGR